MHLQPPHTYVKRTINEELGMNDIIAKILFLFLSISMASYSINNAPISVLACTCVIFNVSNILRIKLHTTIISCGDLFSHSILHGYRSFGLVYATK